MSPDRRVQRTTRLLREALIALSEEKGYDAVTVQEITDRANLGRATFYLHFRDKDDLLLRTLQDTVDDLLERLGPEVSVLLQTGQPSLIPTIFSHAAQHQQLYRIILAGQGAASVERQLRALAAAVTQTHLTTLLGDKESALPVELAANYFANALLGLVKWWLDKDMPYTPEYMTHAFYQLGVAGMLQALDIPIDLPRGNTTH